ncbi:alpha/beta hydrolase [Nocardia higoensis]|uniref:Alpha/beta hydrolase n=1 Tax=Nocardia higoensis TaxID=228599 RepID=A0ABS0D508_9NOCA|nr:alpha/beta hydrolase [Nocardia higoensis]MBF6353559.1 alpha/beta hydrolase [Nocardia higoensis]
MSSRLPSLIAAVTAASVAGAVFTVPAAAHAESVLRADQAIEIPCRTTVLRLRSDWFIPAGAPKGLIWLQHGFARTGAHVSGLATHFAEAGYLVFTPTLPFMDLGGCTLQNLTGNREFLNSVAALFATATDPASTLGVSLSDALERSGRAPMPMPEQMIFLGHSAGAEAVAYVANRLHAAHSAAWADLRGLILLDPVKSFVDNNTDASLTALDGTGLPIQTISAAPSWCNSLGTGTTAVQTYLHRPFLGVRVPGGSHVDAEGTSSDTLGSLVCGSPQTAHVSALDALAVGWADDYLSGASTVTLYPDASGQVAAAPGAEVLRPF